MTGNELEKIHLQWLVFESKSDVIDNVQSWRQNLKFKALPQNLRSSDEYFFAQPCDANERADENATAISHTLCSDTTQTQTQ